MAGDGGGRGGCPHHRRRRRDHLAYDLTHVLNGYTGLEHSLPAVPVYRDVVEMLAQGWTHYYPTLVVDLVGPQGEYYFRQRTDLHADAKLRRFTPHAEIDRKTGRPLVLEEDYRFTMAGEAAARVIRRGGSAVVGGHGEQQGLATHWSSGCSP